MSPRAAGRTEAQVFSLGDATWSELRQWIQGVSLQAKPLLASIANAPLVASLLQEVPEVTEQRARLQDQVEQVKLSLSRIRLEREERETERAALLRRAGTGDDLSAAQREIRTALGELDDREEDLDEQREFLNESARALDTQLYDFRQRGRSAVQHEVRRLLAARYRRALEALTPLNEVTAEIERATALLGATGGIPPRLGPMMPTSCGTW